MSTISVVVAVRDEESMLPGCLRRLGFVDEVVVVLDDRTTDGSAAVAHGAGVTVLEHHFQGFGDLKNAGLSVATGDWVMVVDADERVSRALAEEIRRRIEGPEDAFRVTMANYFHGRLMRWGGWQESPVRLWRSGSARYAGSIHERPELGASAAVGHLEHPLVHFSHRSVIDNLEKSANYVEVAAQAQVASGARRVTQRHIYWTLLREVLFRLVWRQGWRDGVPGAVEALYWPFSHMAAQARLWELQQKPSLDDRYRQLEDIT